MDTLAVGREPLSPELGTRSMRRPVIMPIYCNDTVLEVFLPYIKPILVPDYRVETTYVIEGFGQKLIPPIHSALYAKDKYGDEDQDDAPAPLSLTPTAASAGLPSSSGSVSGTGFTTHPAIIGEIMARPQPSSESFDEASAIGCIREYLKASRVNKPSSKRTFDAFKLLYDLTGKSIARIAKRVNYPTNNCWTVLKQFEQLIHLVPEGWKLYELAEQARVKLSLGWLRDTAQLTPLMQRSEIRGKARKHNITL